MSYTPPLSEAETQLRNIVERMQTTHVPVLLNDEGSAEPVVVVLETDVYQKAQRQQQRFYHLQLTYLKQSLDRVEQDWDSYTLREECVTAWQNGVSLLWEVAPQTTQEFCAALILAVKCLSSESFSKKQLAALRYALELLRYSDPDEATREKAHRLLTDSGLPPLLSYDDDTLVQSYLEEL
ncbi:MAG: hypothetical protein AAF702_07650 [Chloroflexota bacterium]